MYNVIFKSFITIIFIIIIVRFSPVLGGLVCNCRVSATSRSLETPHFPQYIYELFQGWPITVYFQQCQECLTFTIIIIIIIITIIIIIIILLLLLLLLYVITSLKKQSRINNYYILSQN